MKTVFLTISLLTLGAASFPLDLQDRQAVQTTRNELVSGPCKAVTVIFGRGSLQPGNVGEIVGPPFFNNLSGILGTQNVAIQGVDYPATLEQAIAGGSPEGTAELARLANLASTKCPQTKIVLSGYSQGAQIIHLGASKITATARSKIAAVVVFGDPYNGQAITGIPSSKVKSFCATGDFICNGGTSFDPNAHTSYGNNSLEAARFVVSHL